VAPGPRNSSLTRVQPFFELLFDRDLAPTATEDDPSWISQLLDAAPQGRRALGGIVDDPGQMLGVLLGPHPAAKAPRACFEFDVAPSKSFLLWCVDHPEELTWPPGGNYGEEATRMRRALLRDTPPGRQAAQAAARVLVASRPPTTRGWWRFEGLSSIDCVIATDRLVVTVEGKRTEHLSPATHWYPKRTQLVRNLEAARELARGRRWATLLLSEEPEPAGTPDALAASVRDAAPHLDPAQREQLEAAYLGNLTWTDACAATGVDFDALPDRI
jgi:hypothetical protein